MNKYTAISLIALTLIASAFVLNAVASPDGTTTGTGDCTGDGPHYGEHGNHWMRGDAPHDGTGNQYHGSNGQGNLNGTADCPYN